MKYLINNETINLRIWTRKRGHMHEERRAHFIVKLICFAQNLRLNTNRVTRTCELRFLLLFTLGYH